MIEKLLYLLEELKENYSDKLKDEVIRFLFEEFNYWNNIYEQESRIRKALNGQSDAFYDIMAYEFVEELNETASSIYFTVWQPILEIFNTNTRTYFYDTALVIANNSEATDYINGFKELENNNPEIALFHFNRIENSHMANYFKALCYIQTENYENAIKQFEKFLKEEEFVIKHIKEHNNMDLDDDLGNVIARWEVYCDLGCCYSAINEYDAACDAFLKAIDIFSLEETFLTLGEQNNGLGVNSFTIFINNYLIALERTFRYNDCIELLMFVVSKRPRDKYYKDKLKKIKERKEKKDKSDFVFEKILKVKKPFNINSFQSVKVISKERILEDLIIEQIKNGYRVFDKSLEVYQDEEVYGRQYRIPEINGILDLLLIDKEKDQLYVVELKRNETGVEVIDQIENYMNALSKQFNKSIKGIVCLHKSNPKLTQLIKGKKHIELYTYKFDFNNELIS